MSFAARPCQPRQVWSSSASSTINSSPSNRKRAADIAIIVVLLIVTLIFGSNSCPTAFNCLASIFSTKDAFAAVEFKRTTSYNARESPHNARRAPPTPSKSLADNLVSIHLLTMASLTSYSDDPTKSTAS